MYGVQICCFRLDINYQLMLKVLIVMEGVLKRLHACISPYIQIFEYMLIGKLIRLGLFKMPFMDTEDQNSFQSLADKYEAPRNAYKWKGPPDYNNAGTRS